MARILWVSLGGAVGTAARYLLSGWIARRAGGAFPLGTLVVNAAGSLLLGAIMEISLETTLLSPTARLFLTTGVLGGFTTYSTFNYETFRFLQERAWFYGSVNVAATVLGCLAAGAAGVLAARLALGH